MSGIRRLVYGVIGTEADFPPYFEYVKNIRDCKRPKDTRSAFEIVRDMLAALGANE